MPYWTTDTGGYTMEPRFARAQDGDALDEWRELNARWFQYSTFCPILRVHGTDRPREMWNIGDETTRRLPDGAEVRPAPLRAVPVHLFTGGRGHARRLHDDATAGHGLQRRPEGAGRDRPVHVRAGIPGESGDRVQGEKPPGLSASRHVVRLLDGQRFTGGTAVTADAPLEAMPLFVRAGSIVPVGPEQQYIGEKSARVLTLRRTRARTASSPSTKTMERPTATRKRVLTNRDSMGRRGTLMLTVGQRDGILPGMLTTRRFTVVLVTPESPAGYAGMQGGQRTVRYSGQPVRAVF